MATDDEVTELEGTSVRPSRTHREVRVKHEDADNGLIRCPACNGGIQASERGCNLMTCRRPHGDKGTWFYFCFHCRRELPEHGPCMRPTCPERNDRESRAVAKARRNEEAARNPIEISDGEE